MSHIFVLCCHFRAFLLFAPACLPYSFSRSLVDPHHSLKLTILPAGLYQTRVRKGSVRGRKESDAKLEPFVVLSLGGQAVSTKPFRDVRAARNIAAI